MANYIDKQILCEGYTHLDISLYKDKAELEKLRTAMTSFMRERANFLLGHDVDVIVDFEEGSLKTTVTVLGAAASIICAYPNFKEGIKELTGDVTMLAQASNLELIFRTKAQSCTRLRLESRKGIFGRIHTSLSELENHRSALVSEEVPFKPTALRNYNASVNALYEWHKKTNQLFEKINESDSEGCIASGLLEELEKFPKTAPWHRKINSSSFKAILANAEPDTAAKLASANAAYAATLKSIKESLLARIEKSKTKIG